MADFFRDFVAPSIVLPSPDPFMRAHGSLHRGDNLFSATRAFKLTLQSDGNLVLYVIDDGALPVDISQGKYLVPLWWTRTQGTDASHCEMQDDGNLVLYDDSGRVFFSSGTQGHGGSFLRLQDDGNLVVYSFDGHALWSTQTNARQHVSIFG
jgi:hypothetical protein